MTSLNFLKESTNVMHALDGVNQSKKSMNKISGLPVDCHWSARYRPLVWETKRRDMPSRWASLFSCSASLVTASFFFFFSYPFLSSASFRRERGKRERERNWNALWVYLFLSCILFSSSLLLVRASSTICCVLLTRMPNPFRPSYSSMEGVR